MKIVMSIGITIGLLSGGLLALSALGAIPTGSSSLSHTVAETTDAVSKTLDQLSSSYSAGIAEIERNALLVRVEDVSGTYRVEPDAILAAARLDRPVSVLEADVEGRREAIESLPWIAKATIALKLSPARLSITVKEEEPWIVAEYEGHSWLVSQSGVLLQTLDSIADTDLVMEISELPRFSGLKPDENGKGFLRSSNARFEYGLTLLEFIDLAGGLPFEVEEYILLPDGALRATAKDFREKPAVVFHLASLEEAKSAIRRLSSVIEDLETRQEKASLIDLRFNNQAVVR